MSKKESPNTEKLRKMFPRKPLSQVELKKKYPWIVPGSLQGEGNERTVEIRCQNEGCNKKRRTRTMDVFQVRYCEECQKERDAELLRVRRRRWRERDRERRRAMREGEP